MNKTIRLIIPLMIILCAYSCEEKGSGMNENPFENMEGSALSVSYTNTADSVKLNWQLTVDVDFDGCRVKDAAGKNDISLPKDAVSCCLTRIPYNTPVRISIEMLSGGNTVSETPVTVVIDGVDHVFGKNIIQDNSGVTAGDGMYSIALPDGRSIFLMGDSYVGKVTEGRRSTSDHMYRNTYNVYDNGKTTALYAVNGGKSSAAVPPGVTNEGQKWYWPGHGYVVDDTLYIFQTLMYQGAEGAWGFMYETTRILEYSLPDLKLKKDTAIPCHAPENVHYGMAAINDGDYQYIYAQVDIENDWDPVTEVYVARTTVKDMYSKWEFYNGSGWSENSGSAVAMTGISSVAVSSQFNVFKLRDKYVLFTSAKNWDSRKVYTFISDTPYGPWRNKKLIFELPALAQKNWYSYNAMAHPQFERNGMILASYCVNTDNFSEQFSNVASYRPIFYWLDIDTILKK